MAFRTSIRSIWHNINQSKHDLLFIKNVSSLLVGNIVTKLAAIIVVSLIGRSLGAEVLGDYTLGLAWGAVVFRLAEFGLPITLLREVSKDPRHTTIYLYNLLPMHLIGLLLGIGVILGIIHIIGYPVNTQIVITGVAVIGAINAHGAFLAGIFEANQKMEYEATVQFLQGVLIIAFVPLTLYVGGTILSIIWVLAIIAGIQMLVTYWILNKNFVPVPRFEFDFSLWRIFIRESYPLAFAGIFAIIYYRIDALMLSIYMGSEAVGYYNAAYSLIGGLTILSAAYLKSQFPRFAKLTSDISELRRQLRNSLIAMGALGGGISIVIFIFSPTIISIIFGESFLGKSDLALAILSWTILFRFLSSTLGVFLNATGHQRAGMYITAIIALLNIGLNLAVIPYWGYLGTSATTVICYGCGAILMFIYIYRYCFPSKPITKI